GGRATLLSHQNVKYCFDYLAIKQLEAAGDALFVTSSNSTVEDSPGWIEAECEEVLFADFSFRSPCAGSATFFEDLSDGNPDRWLWDFGDGNTADEQYPIHTYSAPGIYLVNLEVFENSNSSSITFEVLIEPSTINETPEIVLENGRLLTNTAGNAFQWYLNEQVLPGENNRLLSKSPGPGSYRVEVTNGLCSAISEPFLVTSINENNLSSFSLFPNPVVDGVVRLKTNQKGVVQVRLMDLSGKTIKKANYVLDAETDQLLLSVKDVDSGIYVLQINGSNQIKFYARVKVL
ncbi:MAG: PKD domain-containing protein, partial [Bacteroidota bacterium]